jgi:hypothetical protein
MKAAHSWTQKLLADAADVKVCRNCGLCYMRSDSQSGYCKRNRPGRPPEVPLVVDEFHTCDGWTAAPTPVPKETPRDAQKKPKRPPAAPTSQAKLPKSLPKIQGLPKGSRIPFGKRRGPPTPKDDA